MPLPPPDDSVLRFEREWEALRAQADQPPPRRRVVRDKTQLAAALPYIEAAAHVADMVRHRLDVGYVWRGGYVGGHYVPPLVETGLRTQAEDAHVLRRFVQLTPRARRSDTGLHCGHTKGMLARPDTKLLGLDEAYVALNPTMRGAWRVDLDADFPSWIALRDDLEALVAAGRLPCLPHACVAWRCPHTGRVAHPHLWWLLPYGSSVWWAPEDPRCSRRIMSLYSGVVAGCTAALSPLGADPSAASLPLKGKSPLCPLWSSVFWNQSRFPSLSEWAEYVDTGVTAGRLARRAAREETGLDAEASNSRFLACQTLAFDTLRQMHAGDDPEYRDALADRAQLSALLQTRCRRAVAAMANEHRERLRSSAIFCRVADYAAGAWDPSRQRGGVDRGACADRVAGLALAERQAVGGRYGAGQRADTSRRTIAAAVAALRETGGIATQQAVADATGLSLRTVKRHWAVRALCAETGEGVTQCIDPQEAGGAGRDSEAPSSRTTEEGDAQRKTAA